MNVHPLYDEMTGTWTYIVSCSSTKSCIVIDPVLNFEPHAGVISYESIEAIIQYLDVHELSLEWILETHVHADHLSGAAVLKQKRGGQCAIGEGIHKVISHWAPKYNLSVNELATVSVFDKYLKPGDSLSFGELDVQIFATPGHTPACMSFLIEDALFVGDTLFDPSLGTARCDFPGGSAKALYEAIQWMYSLPDETRVYTGHDYPAPGHTPRALSTIKSQKTHNILLNEHTALTDYISAREKRDRTLPVPKLILFALQVNLTGGVLPLAESNGVRYLKIPLTMSER